MFLLVDLAAGGASDAHPSISVREPNDFGRLHVEVVGSDGKDAAVTALRRVLEATHTGWLAGSNEAFLRVGALKHLCSSLGSGGWEEKFASMVEAADGNGWASPEGDALRAHVLWGPPAV